MHKLEQIKIGGFSPRVNSPELTEKYLQTAKESLTHLFQRSEIGFTKMPDRHELWEACFKLSESYKNKINRIVVIGIGGSSLGAKVFCDLQLVEKASSVKVDFLDSVDPLYVSAILDSLSVEDTLFLPISKSGNTIETLITVDYIKQKFSKQNLKFVVITEEKESALNTWAKKNNHPTLPVPLDVGGRFSVLTPVEIFLACLLGYDYKQIQAGAKAANEDKESVSLMTQKLHESFLREEEICYYWIYSQVFKGLGPWWQQLWAESLGKRETRSQDKASQFAVPIPLVGPGDQHSVLQQLMEGGQKQLILFHQFECVNNAGDSLNEDEFGIYNYFENKNFGKLIYAESLSTEKALNENQISTLRLTSSQQNKLFTVGYLFQFWMLVVGTLGELHNINAFNQPGVELGKRLAQEMLKKS
jgi:glucose-6-phosphate isomerase